MPDIINQVSAVIAAATFAAERHRTQRRKDEEASPYINHPLRVAQILCETGVQDTETIIAALLHDTVEDTETSLSEIADLFGETVSRLVAEVSDDKRFQKAERKRLQILNAPKKSNGAKLIKIADKIANLQDLAHAPPAWSEERMEAYRRFATDVAAGCHGINERLDKLFSKTVSGLT